MFSVNKNQHFVTITLIQFVNRKSQTQTQTWPAKEERVCALCDTGEVETDTVVYIKRGERNTLEKLSNLMPVYSSSETDVILREDSFNFVNLNVLINVLIQIYYLK